MSTRIRWALVGGFLMAVLVAAVGFKVAQAPHPGTTPTPVSVASVVAFAQADGYQVLAKTLQDCNLDRLWAEAAGDGYAVLTPAPTEAFDDLTCLIPTEEQRRGVPLFTAETDPAGSTVTVNGQAFTIG